MPSLKELNSIKWKIGPWCVKLPHNSIRIDFKVKAMLYVCVCVCSVYVCVYFQRWVKWCPEEVARCPCLQTYWWTHSPTWLCLQTYWWTHSPTWLPEILLSAVQGTEMHLLKHKAAAVALRIHNNHIHEAWRLVIILLSLVILNCIGGNLPLWNIMFFVLNCMCFWLQLDCVVLCWVWLSLPFIWLHNQEPVKKKS